jgi:DNA-binding beta-propeller fold protein YncE
MAQTANYAGVVTTLETGLNVLQGVAVDASGNIYLAAGYQSTIEELVAVNGSVPANPTTRKLGSGFSQPHGMAVDASGNVYDLFDRAVVGIRDKDVHAGICCYALRMPEAAAKRLRAGWHCL